MNILIFNENSMGYITNNTNLIYLFIISCGIYVITSKNPIISILNLILLFSVVACYLILLNASFIGLSYLLVYVGAVSILFLFILMLINVRISELVTDNNNSIPLSLFIISVFVIVSRISMTLYSYEENIPVVSGIKEQILSHNWREIDFSKIDFSKIHVINNEPITIHNDLYNNNIYNGSAYTWDTFVTSTSHINSIGNIMYTSYPILLLIISIILLLSMIGAIVITVRR